MHRRLDFLSLGFLRRIEIRYRLINSFILVSLVPLLISGLLAYRETSRATQDKVRAYSVQVARQISQNLLLRMEKIEDTSEELALSDKLQRLLGDYYSGHEAASAAARSGVARVLLDTYGALPDVNQKYLLDRRRQVIDPQIFAPLAGSISRVAEEAPDLGGRAWWTLYHAGHGQKSVAMLREIRFTGNNRPAGYLFVGVRPSYFFSIFEGVELGYDSSIFIVDASDGTVVVQGRDGSASTADPALLSGISESLSQRRTSDFIAYTGLDKTRYYAAIAKLPHSSWWVVSTTPSDKLNADTRSVRDKIIAIGLGCFAVSLLLSALIARSISVPLQRLVGAMKEAGSGDTTVRVAQEGGDEIAVLSRKFNEMAGKLQQNKEELEQQVALRTHELERANRKLEALSATDGLTGVANRRRFDEVLVNELRRSVRSGHPLALLMLDVDYFKKYNDRYGHVAGDECLRIVARVLQKSSRRATDLVARYGGEEFSVIIAESDTAHALQQAENICQAIFELKLPHADSPSGYITASIGVAALQADDSTTAEQVVRIADQALYHAKYQGRNRVVLGSDATRNL
ncbi:MULTISPECIES: sensor domain-containing diguanylate cyclase [Herbaspirillum]|uniref:diguanylate cyclase n=1 Tax=Herbaspirillum frisingense GSF30 TaxID=864073 RepID=A0AAI9N2P1_9BURK|nr:MULTISPECIES: sensor domain-containing diguanylate cyclase [Herbaspirillum]EOA03593.1 diguanylate cyclase/phosphodiesterase with PAS/PAC sensor domain-containing protein [Herbaspirillum frisingense GSF30]MCI1015203.1 diguanylate cyclase [Herbaspirillum sp. C7C2]ONN65303.1 GGDEF domain-containing protein [Herbaspirillum sp. VT-16-41]